MTAEDIRKAYLEFFAARDHVVIPRAKLIPEGDPTTLFTGSGMQPMIPYLLGEPHPAGKRIADSQTCLRAQDIDEVGNNRHTTFFEMLGNWSLGDYFKDEQIPWMFEFLTEVVGLDPAKLYITCFIGAPEYDIAKDTRTAELWQSLFKKVRIDAKIADIGSATDGYKRGLRDDERILYYDGSKNWWSRGGDPERTLVGDPCGPDSEMFYDFGTPHDAEFGEHCHPNCDCGRFMEIGNNVFMAYKKVADSKFEPLAKPNVDHGSGLERITAAAIDNPDIFQISLMRPIIDELERLSSKNYDSNATAMRVIADHLRAAVFLAVDGVKPSNKEQGYVMRRLIRRAVRFAFELGIEQNFLPEIVPVIADIYADDFPEVAAARDDVIATLVKEEKAFRQTLRKGLKEFERLIKGESSSASAVSAESQLDVARLSKDGERVSEESCDDRHDERRDINVAMEARLTGKEIFTLYDTYGFPLELSVEEAFKQGVDLSENWRAEFDDQMAEQRERSHTATKGTFKGGLGGHTLQHKKYHTATHLLQSALRKIFGDQLRQHGSNITEERLRFDFNLDRKMTPEEIAEAEDLVNGWIADDLPVSFCEYPTDQALEMGAIGPFGERYGDTVKVYQMGEGDRIVSLEICGGPHVDRTGVLAELPTSHPGLDPGSKKMKFKITKEEATAAGIRRVKAILE
ncbi:alanine--tRNA ligase-related protein [Candidatus Saccharibacteria bacterium]|nr:alanine--tRNA ligase-related protein [Candidatus Saccharibacteria bacterium]